MPECVACDTGLGATPYRCRYCEEPVCEDHRLPENHACVYQSLADAPDSTSSPDRKRSRARSETSTATPLRKDTSDPNRATFGSSPPSRAPSSSDPPTSRSPPVETKSDDDNGTTATNISLSSYIPPVTRRSFDRKVGATVITLGKLAVVALAVIGALAIYQAGFLAPLSSAGGQPANTPTAAVEAAGAANTTATPTQRPTMTATTTSDADAIVQQGYNLNKTKRIFIQLLNEERDSRDLQTVDRRDVLTEMGRAHSRDMAERGYFDHKEPDGTTIEDRYRARGLLPECTLHTDRGSYYEGAENIAQYWVDATVQTSEGDIYVGSERDLARGLYRSWMNSEGHREAMLVISADQAGLGIWITDSGKVYASLELC